MAKIDHVKMGRSQIVYDKMGRENNNNNNNNIIIIIII